MLKRNTRLRREYLYRKGLEGREKEVYEQKRKVRQALEVSERACSRAPPSPCPRRPSWPSHRAPCGAFVDCIRGDAGAARPLSLRFPAWKRIFRPHPLPLPSRLAGGEAAPDRAAEGPGAPEPGGARGRQHRCGTCDV